jgi:hypothetical protein
MEKQMIAAFKNYKWIFAAIISAFCGVVLFVSIARSGFIDNIPDIGEMGSIPDNVSTSLLTVDPLTSTIFVGEVTTVNVVIQDVSNLYGVQIRFSFAPNLLQVIDADPVKDDVQITPGSCPSPDFIVQHTVSNTLGTVAYSATSLNPTPPCSGSGVVASIQFQALTDGDSDIHFTEWILADSDGEPIPAAALDGTIRVSSPNKVFIPIVLK